MESGRKVCDNWTSDFRSEITLCNPTNVSVKILKVIVTVDIISWVMHLYCKAVLQCVKQIQCCLLSQHYRFDILSE